MSSLRADLAGMLHERDGFGVPEDGADCPSCLATVDLLLPRIEEEIDRELRPRAAWVSSPADPAAVRDVLRVHHPTMRSETGSFSMLG